MPNRNLFDRVQQGLTEQGVNLYQTPRELELNFEGDIAGDTQGLDILRPVDGTARVDYLPMTIELLPPKVSVNLDRLQQDNLEFQQLANDPVSAGEAPVLADGILESAQNYLLTIQALEFLPALVLYINPNDFTRNHQRKVNSQFAGQGHITEHWGEEQKSLSASGRIGAAYTDKTGLTRYFRRNAASYQQLMHLYTMYRNNGYLYETVDINRIGLVGRVQLSYDSDIWVGHFDSFSMSEAADNPHTMEYSFEFTAREYTRNSTISTIEGSNSTSDTINPDLFEAF